MNLSTKWKDSQTQRTDLRLPRGRRGREEKDWESGISKCKPVYIGRINNKVLLYTTGNYIQYPVIKQYGKKDEKEYIYVCVCVYIYIYTPPNIYMYN